MDLSPFEDFELRVSDDPAKTDLELTCPHCDGVVCDIEHGDSLGTLTRCSTDHANSCTFAAGTDGGPSRYEHPPQFAGRYEGCVLDSEGNCSRWNHDHAPATPVDEELPPQCPSRCGHNEPCPNPWHDHQRTGWQVHAEHVERANRERLHDLSVIDELKSLLSRACQTDAREDCWLDHNGGCQAHGFLSEPCPYPLIRQYLRVCGPTTEAQR